jgi:hypothetical protein
MSFCSSLESTEATYEVDVSGRIIEMDGCEDNVRDGYIRLCYDGKDRTRCAILIMLRLVVYNYSRRMRRWYWRHLTL